jgi:pimeloyl-ACP methyl ester carboxylesterase
VAPGFTCITLTVPLDHFGDGPETADVTFALRRHTAPGAARGVLVSAVGGPGLSGIASASAEAAALASAVRTRYDLVWFDQRGVGRSGGGDCPDAAVAWYRSGTPSPSGDPAPVREAARRFAADCVAEARLDPGRLPYLTTRQAAEDLEALRIYLGEEALTIYGESYGSRLALAYASAHPDRVAALLLDAPVDPTRPASEIRAESVRAFDQALLATMLACSASVPCTRDVKGGDALAAYDALAAELAASPVTVRTSSGEGPDLRFTAGDLATVVAASLGTPADRALLQRAIAAASQGRWWYLARLLELRLGIDPDTGETRRDVTRSDAGYYAISCADAASGEPPEPRADAQLEQGIGLGVDAQRLGSVFYRDLPCAWWPAGDAAAEPLTLPERPGYPVIVMGATLDPATPWANAERIARTIGRRTRSIVTAGGPHVTFGRGEECPDRLVTALLIKGQLPPARTTCPGSVTEPYAPLPPASVRGVASTRDALVTADREILLAPDYVEWSGARAMLVPCPYGGTVRYLPEGGETGLRLDRCAWSEGLPLTGEGSIAERTGALRLVLESGDPAAPVTYARSGRDEVSVSGELAPFAPGG